MEKNLEDLRKEIDEIDRELLDLFLRRMDAARQVGEYKAARRLPVLDAQREREILEHKASLAPQGYGGDVRAFFEAVMAISRRRQRRLVEEDDENFAQYLAAKNSARPVQADAVSTARVLYQGQPGAYAEQAAAAFFGEDCSRDNLPLWEDIFVALQRGEADYGVVPIENSSTGSINQAYDLLAKYGAYIAGEVTLRISHCLLAPAGVRLEDVEAVYSHEQGLHQCAPYLKAHPRWDQRPQSNTAAAAKFVAASGKPWAAISSERCAKLYGLNVLARNIAVADDNFTRFVVVSPKLELGQGRDKVSALFTLPHKAGTLHQIMAVFAASGLNLMKLESRPIPGKSWEYLFFVDFSGNLLEDDMDLVIRELTSSATQFRILGNYKSSGEVSI